MLTLGTATPGGGFPFYGQAVADTVKRSTSLEIIRDPMHHGECAHAQTGTLDLARSGSSPTRPGRHRPPPAALQIVAAIYSRPHVVVGPIQRPRAPDRLPALRLRSSGPGLIFARYSSTAWPHRAGLQSRIPRSRGRWPRDGPRRAQSPRSGWRPRRPVFPAVRRRPRPRFIARLDVIRSHTAKPPPELLMGRHLVSRQPPPRLGRSGASSRAPDLAH